jgi:hypothetical protein
MDMLKGTTVLPKWLSILLSSTVLLSACTGSDSSSPASSNPPIAPNPGSTNARVVQQAYLKSPNAGRPGFGGFGGQVALSGDTLAVSAGDSGCSGGINGVPTNNGCEGSGAVYVFVSNGAGGWTQQAYIKASNPGGSFFFGYSLALSGDTLAVGAPNENGCATGVNGNQQQTGCSFSGAVYVYARNAGVWTQQAYVKPSYTNPQLGGAFFGGSVALSGDTLAVGGQYENSCATAINGDPTNNGCFQAGAAYVFARAANGWTQQAYLKAPNAQAEDQFGYSVAVSEDTVAVGAPIEAGCNAGIGGDARNNGCPLAGAVYVFRRTSGNWMHDAYVKASNTEGGDAFGSVVNLSGDTLAVTAMNEGSCARQINGDQANNGCGLTSPGAVAVAGAVYVFTRRDSGWAQQAYVKPSNTDPGDRFGTSLALLGDMLAVGAQAEASCATGVNGDQTNNDCGTAPISGTDTAAGAAYLFARNADVWTQQAYVKASNTEPNDRFGKSVALSERMLAIGGDLEASCATGVNGNQQDNNCPAAGAVYIYAMTP